MDNKEVIDQCCTQNCSECWAVLVNKDGIKVCAWNLLDKTLTRFIIEHKKKTESK